jgi:hypothetical protein
MIISEKAPSLWRYTHRTSKQECYPFYAVITYFVSEYGKENGPLLETGQGKTTYDLGKRG